ncbi:hypothetical protein D9M70_631970 [compost metagenome]
MDDPGVGDQGDMLRGLSEAHQQHVTRLQFSLRHFAQERLPSNRLLQQAIEGVAPVALHVLDGQA